MKVRHFNGSEPVNPLLIRDAYVFVTDSQGGKLLEYNPIELAGVVPLGGPRFCKTEIAQHIADLSTDQRDVLPFSATGFSIMGQQIDEILQVRSSEAILLPYFDGYQHPMDDTSINYNETTAGLTLVNASRKHAIFE